MTGRRAWTTHSTTLQCKDGAVRRRRGAGLRSHLLIGGQLEGSQKTCEEKKQPSDVESAALLIRTRLPIMNMFLNTLASIVYPLHERPPLLYQ